MPKTLKRFFLPFIIFVILWTTCIEVDRSHSRIGAEYWNSYPNLVLAPWNLLLYYASEPLERGPFIPMEYFKEHEVLEQNWRHIQDEALKTMDAAFSTTNFIRRAPTIVNEAQWKVFPLFWYGKDFQQNQEKCPLTTNLLKSIPKVRAAMFSIIPAGKEILPHRGPWKSCMRYHLGLKVPKDNANCFICVDGNKYSWLEGEGRLFDDTYHHYVRNNTDETRIVLFVEVERTLKSKFLNAINQMLIHSPLPGILSTVNNKNEKQKDIKS